MNGKNQTWMNRLIRTGAVVIALVQTGCGQKDAPSIYGGSHAMSSKGSIATIDLRKMGRVILVIKYPAIADMSNIGEGVPPSSSYLSGHKGDDIRGYLESYRVRLHRQEPLPHLDIEWEYHTKTGRLLFNGRSFDLPIDHIGIIRFEENDQPIFDLCADAPEVLADLRSALDISDDLD